MKKVHYLFLLLALAVCGCSMNTSNKNREEDKIEGERITQQYFDLLSKKEYQSVYNLCSPRLQSVSPIDSIIKIYQMTEEKLGTIEDIHLESWETLVQTGTDPKSEYFYRYKVKRTKFESEELFRLGKEGDSIKILQYKINSEGFLK